jgi:hypothetical protein
VETSTLHKFLKILVVHVFKFTNESLSSVQEKHSDIDVTQLCGNFVVISHGVECTEVCNHSLGLKFSANFLLDVYKSIFDSLLISTDNADVEALFGKLNAEFFSHATVSTSDNNI